MSGELISGNSIAKTIRAEIKEEVEKMKTQTGKVLDIYL